MTDENARLTDAEWRAYFPNAKIYHVNSQVKNNTESDDKRLTDLVNSWDDDPYEELER